MTWTQMRLASFKQFMPVYIKKISQDIKAFFFLLTLLMFDQMHFNKVNGIKQDFEMHNKLTSDTNRLIVRASSNVQE